jgi:putative transposase
MTRPLRIEFPGAVYHITSRGNAKAPIFLDDKDRQDFLEILRSIINRFNWLCHTYCLMNNHYHMLIETFEGNLSKGMRQLNGLYTQLFNRKHKRVGHLYQGRYKAILVDKDNYLLSLCRYIVLNPVRAGLANYPEEWKWSSYRSTIGKDKAVACLTIEWILSQFGNERNEAIEKYKDYVKSEDHQKSPLDSLKGQILLGKASFLNKVTDLLKDKEKIQEIPKVQRYASRPSLSELLNKDKIDDKEERGKLVFSAYTDYGYTMQQIAQKLGVHYSTVSRIVRRTEESIS